MDRTWIVVANASRARVFLREGANGPLVEFDAMVNAAVRLRTAETETDRLGPTSAGKSVHNTGGALPNKAYEPPKTPTEHEAELFARSVVASLLQGHQQERFQHLALVASPQFLGLLRQLLDPQLKPLVAWDLNKDYTQLSPMQLQEQLAGQGQPS